MFFKIAVSTAVYPASSVVALLPDRVPRMQVSAQMVLSSHHALLFS
jgi:hypothetical protein